MTMKVLNVEYLGSEWIVYGKADGDRSPDKPIISRLPTADLKIGDSVDFAVAEHHLRFFDKTTERRVPARALSWQ
jgi:ABC-type sugar transport system ATPase subunit